MKESWLEFQSSLDPAQVSRWQLLNTAPTFSDGHWNSVFIMSESPGTLFLFMAHFLSWLCVAMSMAHTLKALTKAENVSSLEPGSHTVPRCALWVLEGMEIEALQWVIYHQWSSMLNSPVGSPFALMLRLMEPVQHLIKRSRWMPSGRQL
jgi:hypothetical protein